MKSFLKYMLASMVGLIITIALFFFISMAIISGIISSAGGEKKITIKSNTVLHIKFTAPIQDRTSNNPFDNFDFESFEPKPVLGLNDILKNIKKARYDDNIKGIILDVSFIPAGTATIEEIRNALLDFKKSDKFIIAYNEIYTQRAYYLASVADKIYVSPQGHLFFNGLQTQITFLKGTLKKIGVDMQVLRGPDNRYKSAVEPLVRNSMSDANEKQFQRLIDVFWDQTLEGISSQRNIAVEKLDQTADEFQLAASKELVNKQLIDGYKYKDEIIEEINQMCDTSGNKKATFISLSKYHSVPVPQKLKQNKDKIGVIYASGEIVLGAGDEEAMGADRIIRTLRKARKDSSLKAIVFRINSGGGSALAAEMIWREAKLLADTKPLIVSLGDVAASGGYYIAAPADTILANPNTITGSIGVFGIFPNAKELLNDKLGINLERITTNKHSDIFAIDRPMSPQEKEILNAAIINTYKVFIERVAEGRNMNIEDVDKIAKGRIWAGLDAQTNGLVDVMGGLKEAVDIAASMAKTEHYKLIELPHRKSPIEQLMKGMSAQARSSLLKKELGDYNYKKLQSVKQLLNSKDRIQTRIPYNIEIY